MIRNTLLHSLCWLIVALASLAPYAAAQTPGTCPRSQGEAYLDVNNVRARILNNGGLFYRGEPHVYEVPKGSGVHALFTTSILIGGLIGGTLHTSATRYGEWEFWPGPLDDLGNPPFDCALYDQLWEINRDDLIAYAQAGIPTENLREWPWRLGAPVLDGDGIAGNYNLDGGDRPALMGDQMLWWVMNDVGNVHESTDSPPIGLEVHGSAFAFQRPGSYINNVTFYRYKLINKNRAPFEEAYFGLYSDPDLGDFSDDYVGSDSTLHLAYVYNADNDDDHRYGYGIGPPALGYTFLRSAMADTDGYDNDRDGTADEPGEQHGLTSFMFFNGVSTAEGGQDPYIDEHYYRYMQGRWKDGKAFTVGGYGRSFSNIPTKLFFSGDPVEGTFWSERNIDNEGTPSIPYDRQVVLSTGPFTMQPGDTEEIVFAIVWSRGDDHLDSVRQLKADTRRLHEVADALLMPDVTFSIPDVAPEPTPLLGFAQNYPNPFRETTTIRYSLPKAVYVRLTIYDVLGRKVDVLVNSTQHAGLYSVDFDGRRVPPGVYVARFEVDGSSFTKTMMLLR